MKNLIVAISLLFGSSLAAQDESEYNNVALHAEFSNVNFHAWKLNDVFVTGGGTRFPAFRTVGLGMLVSQDQFEFRSEWNCAFHYYLPFENEALLNGQIRKTQLRGWEFLSCKDGIDIVMAKLFDISGGIGFYFGNLKLHQGAQKYTNPFVAPMAKIDLRMNVWKISIGARVSGRFDITYSNWKRHSNGMMELPGYKYRELQGVVYIGWLFWSQ